MPHSVPQHLHDWPYATAGTPGKDVPVDPMIGILPAMPHGSEISSRADRASRIVINRFFSWMGRFAEWRAYQSHSGRGM